MAADQTTRDKHVLNALDLPTNRKFWSVIVQVLRKDDIKVGKNGKNFLGLVFTDMQGALVSVVVFEPQIAMFNRLLQPYKRFYLYNAFVKPANPDYKIGEYVYSWTLSGKTHAELIEDSVPYTLPCNFNFTMFSELHRCIERNVPIAIRYLIVHAIPIPGHERGAYYILVNKECVPMLIRVWGDYVDNGQNSVTARLPRPTMAVFINVKVTTYHGLSLATKNNTSVFHNPPIANASALLEWYDKNAEVVRTLIAAEAYKNTDVLLPCPLPAMITSVADAVRTIDAIKATWVLGTVQLLPAQEKLWYTACRGCNRSVNSYITWEFTCTSCGVHTPVRNRCHIGFFLSDATETMPITIFSSDDEQLIGYTADQHKESDDTNVSLVNEIEAAVYKKRVTCFIKYYDKTFRGSSIRAYPVQKMYLLPDVAENAGEPANASPVHAAVSGCPPTSTVSVISDQLSSPTAKIFLGKKSNDTCREQPASTSFMTVKRTMFGLKDSEPYAPSLLETATTVDVAAVTTCATANPLHESSSRAQPPASGKAAISEDGFESPVKRSRNKEKEC